ncbi:GNAT family N-acetyltransferase [uncultured Ruminococcus sp.]|uniref:GNAT family N-acetyltransferase n=1 Tax=uncultured Ruminococcus sp. TaxID=165186 RepID=UPI00292F02BE|nr:GNAT family N-acetyltransferase [uncultured Ruminococcus sp.]
MKEEIIKLEIEDFEKCNNIWDMERQKEIARQCYRELLEGNRTTYIYTLDGEYIAEINLVTEMDDPDYTIPGRRIYVSRLIVKEGFRRRGIGRKLLDFAVATAQEAGYTELSIGVDLDNYAALMLYIGAGFDRVIFIGEDEYGRFVKLLKAV